VLRVTRSGAVKGRAVAITQLKAVIKTAPDDLRDQVRTLDGAILVNRCAGLRPARGQLPTPSPHARRKPRPGRLVDIGAATKCTLATLALRIHRFTEEITDLEDDLDSLLAETAPTLVAMFGVGTDIAGQLLATVGDNPDRIANSAAFGHLCSAAPIPATSGRTQNRHEVRT